MKVLVVFVVIGACLLMFGRSRHVRQAGWELLVIGAGFIGLLHYVAGLAHHS